MTATQRLVPRDRAEALIRECLVLIGKLISDELATPTAVAIASGRQSKSEALGFGDNEFIPWQIGAVM